MDTWLKYFNLPVTEILWEETSYFIPGSDFLKYLFFFFFKLQEQHLNDTFSEKRKQEESMSTSASNIFDVIYLISLHITHTLSPKATWGKLGCPLHRKKKDPHSSRNLAVRLCLWELKKLMLLLLPPPSFQTSIPCQTNIYKRKRKKH